MDGGLSMATIQRDRITHAQVSNLFWVNSALGAGLCLFGILVSPLISLAYDEPRLTLVAAAISLTFLIGGVSVQHEALLRRQMRFKMLAVIDIVSVTLGVIVCTITALMGWQYWALVISPIVSVLVKTIMRWLSVRWIPSMISRGSGVRTLLSFGFNLTGANFIGYFSTNITPFAVGYVGGAQLLGFYNRAYTLTAIPSSQLLPPLMNVMQSALTRVKDDQERLRRVALSLMTKIAMVTMFVTIAMFVTADWIVWIFLGDGWESAIDMFRVLAISTIVTPITTFTAVIMVAVGEAKALMKWKAITLTILSVSIAIGSYWGVMGVLFAHCLSGIFIRMPGFLAYSTMYQPIRLSEYVSSLFPIFFSAIATLMISMVARNYYEPSSALISIILYSTLTGVLFLLFLSFFSGARREVMESFALLKKYI